jgi:hypothetical protein
MSQEENKELILSKLSRMKRLDVEKIVFEILQENPNTGKEFIEEHLNKYDLDNPIILVQNINDIMSKETSMGFLFQDLLNITSDKIGKGEVLLSLCIKDAISGGTEDTDIIMPDERSYEVKKISKGGIFTFSERFTEYNDLGLIMNIAIMNFGPFEIFHGKNLYTVNTKEVRTFKMLIEKFLLPNDDGSVPFYRDQFVVKIDGKIKMINGNTLEKPTRKDKDLEAYCSMFNFREQIFNSKIKEETMTLFKKGCKGKDCTHKMINDLFSKTALKQILKNIEGVFLVMPDLTLSYFTPHGNHDSLHNPEDVFIYSISRNKMNFKGPFLKSTREEKTPGELPDEFRNL